MHTHNTAVISEAQGQYARQVHTDGRTHLSQFDDLPACETEFLVVVQHSVHVLNPDGIHWSVKHIPLLVRSLTAGAQSHQGGEDAVGPSGRGREGAM